MKRLLDSEYRSGTKTASFNSALNQPQDLTSANKVGWGKHRRSIRASIALGFLSCFLLIFTLALGWLFAVKHLKTKVHFLEAADNFVFEIQQARTNEKNYFLYGTHLDEAWKHANVAYNFLEVNAVHWENVIRQDSFLALLNHAKNYLALLEKLLEGSKGEASRNTKEKSALETELRWHGAQMISLAHNIAQRERETVEYLLHWAEQMPLYFLAVFLILIIYLAQKLTRQILGPLSRLLTYTQRIAQGEFPVLIPSRPYGDEFADLIQAMNRMLAELTRRQEILVQSHKLRAIGTLTAGVAHELNNPINNITLTAHMLLQDDQNLSAIDRREMLQDLVSQADRSQGIISHLLNFAHESELKMEPLDLGELVRETLRLAGNQIKLAGVRLDVNIRPDLPPLRGDRQQLSQVILNILINALDAMGSGGRIHIKASCQDQNLFVLKISDNGPGIPPSILPHIFDPFFTTKPPGKGTGLGLAVSQGIIARHGGEISVVSEVGVGTTFTVTLPGQEGEGGR